MKNRVFRILVTVVLVCCLVVSWSPIRARAMAGGGVIGGASAAGLALSPGMVGLLLLAAFGVYYIADNADAIGRSLEVVLEAEATNTELSLAAQAEYAAALTSWWESAKAGAIDLVSAPEWIADAIGLWAESFFNGSSVITSDEPGCGMVSVGDFVTHRFLLSNGALSSNSFSFLAELAHNF